MTQQLPVWQWRDNTDPGEVAKAIADHQVVVVNKVVLDAATLDAADDLQLICAAATGVNNIDLVAAERNGIKVCNARGYATGAVTQHVFATLLTLVTNLDRYRDDVRKGNWSRSEFFCLLDHPITELAGKTMGIVGYGELGQSVARVAEAFGMRVLIAARDAGDKRPGRIALDALLAEVDVLSLHTPLTDSTRNLISTRELSLMKTDAILINTARGGIVDEAALLAALETGELGGAALDVLALEPPDENNPLLESQLPGLIITPHTAWASREARQRVVAETAANIAAFKAGQPRNAVAAA